MLDLCFQRVPEPPFEPPRLHLDLLGGARQTQEVERPLGPGVRHLDIGQRDVPWVVLADPEGNPCCVMEDRAAYADTGPLARLSHSAPGHAAFRAGHRTGGAHATVASTRRSGRACDRWRRVVAMQATWSQPVAEAVVFSNDFASPRELGRARGKHNSAAHRDPTRLVLEQDARTWVAARAQRHRRLLRAGVYRGPQRRDRRDRLAFWACARTFFAQPGSPSSES